jgi:hypothetical protein
MRWVVGTANGLVGTDGGRRLAGDAITALAPDGGSWIVLVEGHRLVRLHGDEVDALGGLGEETGRCVLPIAGGVLVGTAHARLALAADGAVAMVGSFDDAEGRGGWYTPWGGPPDTRSLSASPDGVLFANVHVGGILRAADHRGPWEPTIDVDADVHQVVADPAVAGHVVAATALGLAESFDAGETWRFTTEGLHAPYARAVALDRDVLFMSASTGPRGGRAAAYRREPGGSVFVKCEGGLPEWFAGNVDSHCLAAGGDTIVVGTEDGRVFASDDGGVSWGEAANDLAGVACVALDVSGLGDT